MAKKLDTIKLTKMLSLWGTLPNPDYAFFSKHGMSFHTSLKDLTYIPELQGAILARESAVMGDPWEIICDNYSTAEFIRENINTIGANKIFRCIYNAMWYGYTVLEHPMEKINGKWVYTNIDSLPSDWFTFTGKGYLIPSNHADTSPMNCTIGDIEKEVELVQFRASFSNPYGESLLARVFWYATYIRGGLNLWVSYLDRFGDDSIIGRQLTDNEEKKQEFLQALLEFKSSGALVVDGDYTAEVVKTDKAGSSSLFKDFYTVNSQGIAKVILGHASALEAQAGKLGNDESLGIVRQDITQDDKSLIAETMTRLVKHLCEVNGIKDNVTFIFTPEKEDEKQRIERDKKLVEMGFEPSEEYIRKTYRFGDDEIKRATPQPATNFSEGNEDGKKSDDYYRELDSYINSNIDKFKKPFLDMQKKTLDNILKCEYWEDAFEVIIRSSTSSNADDFAIGMMRAVAEGHLQVHNKVKSLQKAEFSDKDGVSFDTFDEAKKFFTGRVDLKYSDYQKLEDELKHYAFSVKGIVNQQQAQEMSAKLVESFDKGESFYKFKKSVRENKEFDKITELTDRNLELVYSQNMSNAYSYGRYKGLMQAVDIFPNWEYVTIGDKRVRKEHAGVNGTIRRYDDPFWNIWYPPNGFKCRCVVEISTEEPNGSDVPVWNKETHEKSFDKTGGTPTAYAGKKILPDTGFYTNKAQLDSWIGEEVGKMAVVDRLTMVDIKGRTSLIQQKAVNDWNPKDNLEIDKKSISKKVAKTELDSQLINHRVVDTLGNPVFINTDYIIDHIQDEWNTRSQVLPHISKILQNPDEVWGQYDYYSKEGHLMVSKIYLKNINGKPWMAVVEMPKALQSKAKKDMESSALPTLTTVYPVNKSNNLNKKRMGIRLK